MMYDSVTPPKSRPQTTSEDQDESIQYFKVPPPCGSGLRFRSPKPVSGGIGGGSANMASGTPTSSSSGTSATVAACGTVGGGAAVGSAGRGGGGRPKSSVGSADTAASVAAATGAGATSGIAYQRCSHLPHITFRPFVPSAPSLILKRELQFGQVSFIGASAHIINCLLHLKLRVDRPTCKNASAPPESNFMKTPTLQRVYLGPLGAGRPLPAWFNLKMSVSVTEPVRKL